MPKLLALLFVALTASAASAAPTPDGVEAHEPPVQPPEQPATTPVGEQAQEPPVQPPAPSVEEAVLPPSAPTAPRRSLQRLAGSVQLDYLAIPTDRRARRHTLDGATVELSLKLAVELGAHASAQVKLCVACHGPEFGMAYIELHGRDEVNLKVGRFTPAFGSFPIRHDPANHRTSDKPLPYDMGRMVAYEDWNEGILPAPWVDNGVEVFGTRFLGNHQLDYAAYAIGGPKGTAEQSDFDFTLSRSGERYYVDNNSEPTVGARTALTLGLGATRLSLGGSTMLGRYDPEAKLGFAILGFDLALQRGRFSVRAEYLARWNEVDLGADPSSRFKYGPTANGYSDVVLKDGFYVESELALGRIDLIARWDGLRRFGNVLATSPLRSKSAVLRYTGGIAIRVSPSLRVKASVESYDFSDLEDQVGIHLGIVSTF